MDSGNSYTVIFLVMFAALTIIAWRSYKQTKKALERAKPDGRIEKPNYIADDLWHPPGFFHTHPRMEKFLSGYLDPNEYFFEQHVIVDKSAWEFLKEFYNKRQGSTAKEKLPVHRIFECGTLSKEELQRLADWLEFGGIFPFKIVLHEEKKQSEGAEKQTAPTAQLAGYDYLAMAEGMKNKAERYYSTRPWWFDTTGENTITMGRGDTQLIEIGCKGEPEQYFLAFQGLVKRWNLENFDRLHAKEKASRQKAKAI